MINFIKNYELKNIKNKLILLYILNVTDMLFTFFLLSTGYYFEANLFMVEVVKSPIASSILKCILPGVLFMYIYIRMQNATDMQLKKSNLIINILTTFYVSINTFHLLGIMFLGIFIYMS